MNRQLGFSVGFAVIWSVSLLHAADGENSTLLKGRKVSEWISRLNEQNTAEEAAQVLSAAGKAVVPDLVEAFKTRQLSDWRIRENVPLTLIAIGPDAAPSVRTLLETPECRPIALGILWRIEKDPLRVRELLLSETGKEYEGIAFLGTAGVKEVEKLTKDEADKVRQRAVVCLGMTRLATTVPSIIAALDDTDSGVRQSAVIALSGTVTEPTLPRPKLAACLKDDAAAVRVEAARLLLKFPSDDEEIRSLITSTLTDSVLHAPKEVAAKAASTLAAQPSSRATVFAELLKSEDVEVRRRSSQALFNALYYGENFKAKIDVEIVRVLATGMADMDQRVRYCSIFALMRNGDPTGEAIPVLREIAQKDPSDALRRIAGIVLKKSEPKAP